MAVEENLFGDNSHNGFCCLWHPKTNHVNSYHHY